MDKALSRRPPDRVLCGESGVLILSLSAERALSLGSPVFDSGTVVVVGTAILYIHTQCVSVDRRVCERVSEKIVQVASSAIATLKLSWTGTIRKAFMLQRADY
jgi:hypothetical protein